MKLRKILKAIEELADRADSANEVGYSDGWDDGHEHGFASGHLEGYREGWEVKKANTKVRLEMLMETYMNTGKGTKVIFIKEIIEYLDFEYDPIKAEEDYNRMMEDF